MVEYRLIKHTPNQHGFAVSLVKYEGSELVSGFVLRTWFTPEEQKEYITDLAEMTGWEIEDHTA